MIIKGLKWLWEAILAMVEAMLEKVADLGQGMVSSLISTVQAALPSTDLAPFEAILGQIDYVVPITELLGFIALYSSVWSGIWTYRLIKSWIPGASS
jgi:hypothetical protein